MYEKENKCSCWHGFVDDPLFFTASFGGFDDLHEGYATYTGSGYSGGAFLLDPIPSDMEITAINPADLNYGGVKRHLQVLIWKSKGQKEKQLSTLPIYTLKALGSARSVT